MNALIHRLRQATSAAGRRASGHYLLEGTRLVERAQRAGLVVEACAARRYGKTERESALLAAISGVGAPLARLSDEAFAAIASGRDTGAILALAPIPTPVLPASGTLLVAVDVTDPGNAGALVRTAHAGGADALVAMGSTDPFHPKAVRTSMGSICKLPVVRTDAIEILADWHMLGFVCDGEASALPDTKLDGTRVAIVMGSEAFGLSGTLQAALNQRVRIPMPTGVDSFSVNAAAAIALYARLLARLPS